MYTAGIREVITTSVCTSFLKLRRGTIQNGAVQRMTVFKLQYLFRSESPRVPERLLSRDILRG